MRVKCLFMAVLGVVLLETGASAQQSIRAGLDTRGFRDSRFYQRIYYGHFEILQSEAGFVRGMFPELYKDLVIAYGRVCKELLPHDSPTIQIDITNTGSNPFRPLDTHVKYTIDPRFYQKFKEYGVNARGHSFGAIDLFERNGCVSHETIQLLENLLRFAYDQPPVQELAPEPIERYVTKREFERRMSKDAERDLTPHPVDVRATLRIQRKKF